MEHYRDMDRHLTSQGHDFERSETVKDLAFTQNVRQISPEEEARRYGIDRPQGPNEVWAGRFIGLNPRPRWGISKALGWVFYHLFKVAWLSLAQAPEKKDPGSDPRNPDPNRPLVRPLKPLLRPARPPQAPPERRPPTPTSRYVRPPEPNPNPAPSPGKSWPESPSTGLPLDDDFFGFGHPRMRRGERK